jgi:hypothetical protein
MAERDEAEALRLAAKVGVKLDAAAGERVAQLAVSLRDALRARPLPFDTEPAQLVTVLMQEMKS